MCLSTPRFLALTATACPWSASGMRLYGSSASVGPSELLPHGARVSISKFLLGALTGSTWQVNIHVTISYRRDDWEEYAASDAQRAGDGVNRRIGSGRPQGGSGNRTEWTQEQRPEPAFERG
jgi:hypothetical protein